MASLMQIIGLILIAVGMWLIFPPAAIIISGVFIVAIGVALERLKNAKSSATT